MNCRAGAKRSKFVTTAITTLLLSLAALFPGACHRSSWKKKVLPAVSIAVVDGATEEATPASAPARLAITRTGATDQPLEVNLTVAGTASNQPGIDFAEAPLPTSVVIPIGATEVVIEITPLDDALLEGLETVEITLQGVSWSYTLGALDWAAVDIFDDESIVADLTPAEADALIQARGADPDFAILDARTPGEFAAGHLQNAVNIDFFDASFADWIDALDRSRTYLVYCKSGGRSGAARDLMETLGFAEVYNMLGGFTAWAAAGYPSVTD